MTDLFAKYDVPAPRYTSYPTVPFWSDTPTTDQWLRELNDACEDDATTWSLYLHLPFCEALCTFCACNTVITRNHEREDSYVKLLLREWELYTARVPSLRLLARTKRPPRSGLTANSSRRPSPRTTS